MTLEEKAALCTGASPWTTTPVELLGLPELTVSDGPHGVRRVADVNDLIAASCFQLSRRAYPRHKTMEPYAKQRSWMISRSPAVLRPAQSLTLPMLHSQEHPQTLRQSAQDDRSESILLVLVVVAKLVPDSTDVVAWGSPPDLDLILPHGADF